MEIVAEAYSVQLKDRLEEGHVYKVHSRFSHGINVDTGGRLAFIGNKEDEILPYGIVIPGERLPDLHILADAGMLLWENGSFYTDRGCLRMIPRTGQRPARGFSNTLPASIITRGKRCIRSYSRFDYPEMDDRKTGFGESIRSAGTIEGEKKMRLAEAAVTGKDPDTALRQWIGAGPGLTPSGDDYLTGILAADQICGFVCMEFTDTIKQLLGQGYTTDIAKNQLLCALEGMYSGSWIGFMDAYVNADDWNMNRNFYRILDYGHTSGRDMFAGFCMGLSIERAGTRARYGDIDGTYENE